jgi:hypothetical protein
MKSRECGALLVAPPAAPAPAPAAEPAPVLVGVAAHSRGGAADPAGATAGPDDRFFAPTTFTPVTVAPPAERAPAPRRGPAVLVVIVIAIVVCAGAGYAAIRTMSGSESGSAGSGSSAARVALPPVAGSEGLPGLADALRVQAEASRQRAFVIATQATAESGGGPLDITMLQRFDPSMSWVPANESSTGPVVVSFAQSGDTIVVAVANNTRDVCAYGRLPLSGIGEYVTFGSASSCRAADAPASGWTQLTPVGGMRNEPPPEYGY